MATDGSNRLVERIKELEEEVRNLKTGYEKRLKENVSKYRRVIDSTSEGYLELDLDLIIIDCNAMVLSLLGLDKETILNKSIDTFYDKKSVFAHFASKNHLSFEADFKTGSYETIPLLCKRSVIRNSDGRPSGHIAFLTDLTELKNAQERLQEAQARYRTMYRNAVQGMYQSTLDGRILRVNPAFAAIFGFASTTELRSHPGGVTSLYKNSEDREAMLSVLQERHVVKNYEAEMINPTGKTIWALISARLAEDTQGNTIVEGILIDNTEKKSAEEKLRLSRERFRNLANRDSLTNLYNTRYLYSTLDSLIRYSKDTEQPFSLVFLDMDNFKRIVDTYGHLNGSQALKEVARTLKDNLAKPDFGVAYGGDEFVLVLPGKTKVEALEQIHAIRKRMKETTYLKNKGLTVHLSASFGVATFPDDADDRESLLALADDAMFSIKSRGKDAVGTYE